MSCSAAACRYGRRSFAGARRLLGRFLMAFRWIFIVLLCSREID
jgi:hypothetical protein